MKNKTLIGLVALIIIVIGVVWILAKSPADNGSSGVVTPVASSTVYTLAEVSTHNSGASCWTAIRGQVYDVTSWISQHPGGSAAILSLCGTDGTAAFTTQHGGQPQPENQLKNFLLGSLQS